MTDVTTHDLDPFGGAPEGDPSADPRSPADVSQATMSRLRTPFSPEPDGETGNSVRLG